MNIKCLPPLESDRKDQLKGKWLNKRSTGWKKQWILMQEVTKQMILTYMN